MKHKIYLVCVLGISFLIRFPLVAQSAHKTDSIAKQVVNDVNNRTYDSLATRICKATRYVDLLQRIYHNSADSIWQNGKNEAALLEIVMQNHYNDFSRILASELLYHYKKDYPSKGIEDTLASLYSKALFIAGDGSYCIMGNDWNCFYTSYTDIPCSGLPKHLMQTGVKAIPYLKKLLNDTNIIVYEGIEDATGNGLQYWQVNELAAYFIGKILGIPFTLYSSIGDRNSEVENIKREVDIYYADKWQKEKDLYTLHIVKDNSGRFDYFGSEINIQFDWDAIKDSVNVSGNISFKNTSIAQFCTEFWPTCRITDSTGHGMKICFFVTCKGADNIDRKITVMYNIQFLRLTGKDSCLPYNIGETGKIISQHKSGIFFVKECTPDNCKLMYKKNSTL